MFVLVDYTGGSAFKDCVHLPHVTGMVTDLDTHLTQRALASLSAGLTRRERVLAAAGAKDIEEYTERAGREPRCRLLPRLVIVIDEFASRVGDLPDFVAGLVGIAQRGRSLGIHLILATRRPARAVSADIRANANLRIALPGAVPGRPDRRTSARRGDTKPPVGWRRCPGPIWGTRNHDDPKIPPSGRPTARSMT